MTPRSPFHVLLAKARRIPGRLLGMLPGPPDDGGAPDPLLEGIETLPPAEQQARRDAWLAQMRRGRGDGNG
jgi:hypothetical protein